MAWYRQVLGEHPVECLVGGSRYSAVTEKVIFSRMRSRVRADRRLGGLFKFIREQRQKSRKLSLRGLIAQRKNRESREYVTAPVRLLSSEGQFPGEEMNRVFLNALAFCSGEPSDAFGIEPDPVE